MNKFVGRRNALMGGVAFGALVGLSACTGDGDPTPPPAPPTVVDDLRGVFVNLRDYGVTGGDVDESVKFQEAIDYAYQNGLTLFIPAGRYTADGLVLRNGSSIVGAGAETSIIHAVPGSENSSVLRIDQGVLQHVIIEHLGLEGAGNPGQHGFRARAERGSNSSSGMWHSSFSHMRIYNFHGAQLWLEGGGQDALDPVQFLVFNNMVLERNPNVAESISLLMSGQVNQTYWAGSRIDGFGAAATGAAGVNFKICPQLRSYDASIDGRTRYLSKKVGHTHVFAGTTFQQAELAAFVDQAESISFDTCHFEGLANGVLFRNAIGRVDRGHFANATIADTANGYCIGAIDGATVVGSGNMFIGEHGDMARTDDSGASIELTNSHGSEESVTRGLTRSIRTGSRVDVGAASTVELQGAGTVETVTSRHWPGATVAFRASTEPVSFRAGGNISIAGKEIRIAQGGTVTLTRFDSGAPWAVTGAYGAV